MIKYKTINDNKISIFKNVLINNGIATAYYVLYPYNYEVMDLKSSENHINKIYNNISNLYSSFGELRISIFKLINIVSKQTIIDNIVNTIKMYKKDYNDLPNEFKKYIKDISRDFSILAVNIELKNSIDLESQSIVSVMKEMFDTFVKTNFSTNIVEIDEDAIASQNQRIKNILNRCAVPANEKLVMNIYLNSVFPSYNLVYNDFSLNHSVPILNAIKQEIIPHFGWFEMSNSGIEILGGEPQTTYGSILTILEFPEAIQSENFNIALPGLCVNMHLLPKDKAILKFKRMRADIDEEQEEVESVNAKDSDIDDQAQGVQLALDQLRAGRIVTEVDAKILVLANSKEELDLKKKHIISVLSDINIVCSISQNQSKTFVDSFIKHRPQEFYHLMDLQYALSFQLDSGVLMGDQDSNFSSLPIGNGIRR